MMNKFTESLCIIQWTWMFYKNYAKENKMQLFVGIIFHCYQFILIERYVQNYCSQTVRLTTIILLTDKLVWIKNIYDLSYLMLEHSRVRYPNWLLEILYVNALNFLLRSSVIYVCIWANLLVHITFYINEDLSLFYW